MPLMWGLARRLLSAVPPAMRAVNRARVNRAISFIDPTRPETLPVLVYQMGKVGSSTVAAALRATPSLRRPVLTVHFMVPSRIAKARAYDQQGSGRRAPNGYTWMLGAAVGARLAEIGDRVRIPVVSLVRDPIAREVSGTFQNPQLFRAELRDARGRIDVPRAVAFLRERFLRPDAFGYSEHWFRQELAVTFGIDVFDEPFDRERGYQIVRSRRADVLLLRTEDLDRTLAPGVRDLLGVDVGDVLRANERVATSDGEAYRRVVEALRLPRETVERIYTGRFARHFYGKEWIERFVKRWSDPTPA